MVDALRAFSPLGGVAFGGSAEFGIHLGRGASRPYPQTPTRARAVPWTPFAEEIYSGALGAAPSQLATLKQE